ncbi:MAG: hypothetical protein C4345_11085, partial [Chloroflexota bacterium]
MQEHAKLARLKGSDIYGPGAGEGHRRSGYREAAITGSVVQATGEGGTGYAGKNGLVDVSVG